MNAKKWRIGLIVSLFFSLLTAGAGLSQGMKWQAFIAVFCAAAVTNLGAYLMKHPVESITDETTISLKKTSSDGTVIKTDTTSKTTIEMPPPYDANLVKPEHPGDPRTPE